MARIKLTPRQAFALMCAAVNSNGTLYVPTHDHGPSSVTWVIDGKKLHVRNVLGFGRQEVGGLTRRGLMVENHSVFTITESGRAALALRPDLVRDLIALSDERDRREQETSAAEDAEWKRRV